MGEIAQDRCYFKMSVRYMAKGMRTSHRSLIAEHRSVSFNSSHSSEGFFHQILDPSFRDLFKNLCRETNLFLDFPLCVE